MMVRPVYLTLKMFVFNSLTHFLKLVKLSHTRVSYRVIAVPVSSRPVAYY